MNQFILLCFVLSLLSFSLQETPVDGTIIVKTQDECFTVMSRKWDSTSKENKNPTITFSGTNQCKDNLNSFPLVPISVNFVYKGAAENKAVSLDCSENPCKIKTNENSDPIVLMNAISTITFDYKGQQKQTVELHETCVFLKTEEQSEDTFSPYTKIYSFYLRNEIQECSNITSSDYSLHANFTFSRLSDVALDKYFTYYFFFGEDFSCSVKLPYLVNDFTLKWGNSQQVLDSDSSSNPIAVQSSLFKFYNITVKDDFWIYLDNQDEKISSSPIKKALFSVDFPVSYICPPIIVPNYESISNGDNIFEITTSNIGLSNTTYHIGLSNECFLYSYSSDSFSKLTLEKENNVYVLPTTNELNGNLLICVGEADGTMAYQFDTLLFFANDHKCSSYDGNSCSNGGEKCISINHVGDDGVSSSICRENKGSADFFQLHFYPYEDYKDLNRTFVLELAYDYLDFNFIYLRDSAVTVAYNYSYAQPDVYVFTRHTVDQNNPTPFYNYPNKIDYAVDYLFISYYDNENYYTQRIEYSKTGADDVSLSILGNITADENVYYSYYTAVPSFQAIDAQFNYFVLSKPPKFIKPPINPSLAYTYRFEDQLIWVDNHNLIKMQPGDSTRFLVCSELPDTKTIFISLNAYLPSANFFTVGIKKDTWIVCTNTDIASYVASGSFDNWVSTVTRLLYTPISKTCIAEFPNCEVCTDTTTKYDTNDERHYYSVACQKCLIGYQKNSYGKCEKCLENQFGDGEFCHNLYSATYVNSKIVIEKDESLGDIGQIIDKCDLNTNDTHIEICLNVFNKVLIDTDMVLSFNYTSRNDLKRTVYVKLDSNCEQFSSEEDCELARDFGCRFSYNKCFIEPVSCTSIDIKEQCEYANLKLNCKWNESHNNNNKGSCEVDNNEDCYSIKSETDCKYYGSKCEWVQLQNNNFVCANITNSCFEAGHFESKCKTGNNKYACEFKWPDDSVDFYYCEDGDTSLYCNGTCTMIDVLSCPLIQSEQDCIRKEGCSWSNNVCTDTSLSCVSCQTKIQCDALKDKYNCEYLNGQCGVKDGNDCKKRMTFVDCDYDGNCVWVENVHNYVGTEYIGTSSNCTNKIPTRQFSTDLDEIACRSNSDFYWVESIRKCSMKIKVDECSDVNYRAGCEYCNITYHSISEEINWVWTKLTSGHEECVKTTPCGTEKNFDVTSERMCSYCSDFEWNSNLNMCYQKKACDYDLTFGECEICKDNNNDNSRQWKWVSLKSHPTDGKCTRITTCETKINYDKYKPYICAACNSTDSEYVWEDSTQICAVVPKSCHEINNALSNCESDSCIELEASCKVASTTLHCKFEANTCVVEDSESDKCVKAMTENDCNDLSECYWNNECVKIPGSCSEAEKSKAKCLSIEESHNCKWNESENQCEYKSANCVDRKAEKDCVGSCRWIDDNKICIPILPCSLASSKVYCDNAVEDGKICHWINNHCIGSALDCELNQMKENCEANSDLCMWSDGSCFTKRTQCIDSTKIQCNNIQLNGKSLCEWNENLVKCFPKFESDFNCRWFNNKEDCSFLSDHDCIFQQDEANSEIGKCVKKLQCNEIDSNDGIPAEDKQAYCVANSNCFWTKTNNNCIFKPKACNEANIKDACEEIKDLGCKWDTDYNSCIINQACGSDCTWKIVENVLTVSGTVMADFEPFSAPWYNQKGITYVVFDVENIGSFALSGLTSLNKIKLTSRVKNVSLNSFSSLISFYKAESRIGGSIFDIHHPYISELPDFSQIEVDPNNDRFTVYDNVLYQIIGNGQWTALVSPPNNDITDLEFPPNVISIEAWAFVSSKHLQNVRLNKVRSIGIGAFALCEALQTLTIPVDSSDKPFINYIGDSAFVKVKFTDISFSAVAGSFNNGLCQTKGQCGSFIIDSNALFSTRYGFPILITTFGKHSDETFAITINEDIMENIRTNDGIRLVIGADAFSFTSFKKIEFPTVLDLTELGDFAFFGCQSLVDISLSSSLETIREGVFAKSGLTSIHFNSNLKLIKSGAFASCTDLQNVTSSSTESIEIGEYAFSGCTSLKSFDVLKISSIGSRAFAGTGLISFYFPSSVQTIGDYAFYNSQELSNVTSSIENSNSFICGSNVFTNCMVSRVIVPKEYSLNSFCNIPSVRKDASVDTGECGDDCIWEIVTGGTLRINGTGEMDDYEQGNAPWYSYASLIYHVSIEGISKISQSAFFNLRKLSDVDIGSSVTFVDNQAFLNCSSLTTFTFGSGLSYLGYLAFGFTSLSNINMVNNKNFYYDGKVLFSADKRTLVLYPPGLEDVQYEVPATVKQIEKWAFATNNYLHELNLNAYVNDIGNNAFTYVQLNKITVDPNNKSYKIIDSDISPLQENSCQDKSEEIATLTNNKIIYKWVPLLSGDYSCSRKVASPDDATDEGECRRFNCRETTDVNCEFTSAEYEWLAPQKKCIHTFEGCIGADEYQCEFKTSECMWTSYTNNAQENVTKCIERVNCNEDYIIENFDEDKCSVCSGYKYVKLSSGVYQCAKVGLVAEAVTEGQCIAARDYIEGVYKFIEDTHSCTRISKSCAASNTYASCKTLEKCNWRDSSCVLSSSDLCGDSDTLKADCESAVCSDYTYVSYTSVISHQLVSRCVPKRNDCHNYSSFEELDCNSCSGKTYISYINMANEEIKKCITITDCSTSDEDHCNSSVCSGYKFVKLSSGDYECASIGTVATAQSEAQCLASRDYDETAYIWDSTTSKCSRIPSSCVDATSKVLCEKVGHEGYCTWSDSNSQCLLTADTDCAGASKNDCESTKCSEYIYVSYESSEHGEIKKCIKKKAECSGSDEDYCHSDYCSSINYTWILSSCVEKNKGPASSSEAECSANDGTFVWLPFDSSGLCLQINVLSFLVKTDDNTLIYYPSGLQESNVRIPEDSINSIGTWAFYGNTNIKSLYIKRNINAIALNSFYGCENLKSIYISKSNKSFKNGETDVDDGIVYSYSGDTLIFYPPGKSDRDFTIPNSVHVIGDNAFYWNTALESLTITVNVTKISSNAFNSARVLSSISILDPSNIDIDSSAFVGCSSLTSLTLGSDYATNQTVGFKYICNSLANLISVEFKPSISSIGRYAFSGCNSLASLYLSSNIRSINYFAFYLCKSIKSVVLEDGSIDIKSNAFSGCSSLASITIGTDSIEDRISITQTFRTLMPYLTSVTLKDNIVSIGPKAFSRCSRLSSFYIPERVESIGDYAFTRCSRLSSIDVASSNKRYLSENGVLFERITDSSSNLTIYHLVAYPAGKSGSYSVSSNVKSILDRAFEGALVKEVVIDSSVTSIGDYAFSGCSKLEKVTLPGYSCTIGESAFSGCISIVSLTIPGSITEIKAYAFNRCTQLNETRFEGKANPSVCADTAFTDCVKLPYINVDDDYQGKFFCGYDVSKPSDSVTSSIINGATKKVLTLGGALLLLIASLVILL